MSIPWKLPWKSPDPSSSNIVGCDSTCGALSSIFGPDPEPSSRSKEAKKSPSDAAFSRAFTSGCEVVVTMTVVCTSATSSGSAAESLSELR
jgi:hypothetical protein